MPDDAAGASAAASTSAVAQEPSAPASEEDAASPDHRPTGADESIESAALLLLMRETLHQQHGHRRPGGATLASRLLTSGSAQAVLAAGEDGQTSLLQQPALEESLLLVRAWRRRGIRLLGIHQSEYPPPLRDLASPPAVLFARGRVFPSRSICVAVIGSRSASGAGRRAATALARELVATGCVVVSGLAAGVDAAAHGEVLAQAGHTVGVIGTGMLHTYPPQHRDLQEAIAQRGTLLSQFLPDTPPSRRTFPQRNEVMSGVTVATAVIEASARSGARIQARHALQQGRMLFLHKLALRNEWAQDLLGHRGVHAFTEPAELVAWLSR